MLEQCSYCGMSRVEAYKHHTNRCVECGKLYERYRSAKKRRSFKSACDIGRQIIERGKHMRIYKHEEFFRRLEREIRDMNKLIIDEPLELQRPAMPERPLTKVCKQCGRALPVDKFVKYPARGRGIYNTTQGYHTICKDCESISRRADYALKNNDSVMIDKLTEHYKVLQSRGLEPATKPAKILLDIDTVHVRMPGNVDDLLADIQSASGEATQSTQEPSETPLEKHCRLVRTRGYNSFDEADKVHRTLLAELQEDPDLYEEINDLMDEWFDEE